MRLDALDKALLRSPPPLLARLPRPLLELGYFTAREARACLFAGLFFAAIFLVPRAGVFGLPRYDVLLLVAIAIQAWMVLSKLRLARPLTWLRPVIPGRTARRRRARSSYRLTS